MTLHYGSCGEPACAEMTGEMVSVRAVPRGEHRARCRAACVAVRQDGGHGLEQNSRLRKRRVTACKQCHVNAARLLSAIAALTLPDEVGLLCMTARARQPIVSRTIMPVMTAGCTVVLSPRELSLLQSTGMSSEGCPCSAGNLGVELEVEAAAATAALDPPHIYVPWVTVNDVAIGQGYQFLLTFVCAAYTGNR